MIRIKMDKPIVPILACCGFIILVVNWIGFFSGEVLYIPPEVFVEVNEANYYWPWLFLSLPETSLLNIAGLASVVTPLVILSLPKEQDRMLTVVVNLVSRLVLVEILGRLTVMPWVYPRVVAASNSSVWHNYIMVARLGILFCSMVLLIQLCYSKHGQNFEFEKLNKRSIGDLAFLRSVGMVKTLFVSIAILGSALILQYLMFRLGSLESRILHLQVLEYFLLQSRMIIPYLALLAICLHSLASRFLLVKKQDFITFTKLGKYFTLFFFSFILAFFLIWNLFSKPINDPNFVMCDDRSHYQVWEYLRNTRNWDFKALSSHGFYGLWFPTLFLLVVSVRFHR